MGHCYDESVTSRRWNPMVLCTRLAPSATRLFGWGILAVGLATFAAPAQAISSTAAYDSTITSDPNSALITSAIGTAISFYQSIISTNINVNITFKEGGGLGASSTYYNTISYASFVSALTSHSSGDATDVSALASLPGGSTNPVNGNGSVSLTTANARALGFSTPGVTTDSTITLNTSIMNYTGTTYNSGYYSLVAVAEHEIDEALGIGSALNSGSTSGAVWVEDLFRYASAGTRSYTTASGATAYFSVDGGVTNIAGFNQPGCTNCSDYNDWNGATVRIQNAFGTPGVAGDLSFALTSPEANVLDAIGYNFIATPEPASFGMVGLGGIALFLFRRRSTK